MSESRLVRGLLAVLTGSTACEVHSDDVGSSTTGSTSSSSSDASGDSGLESGGSSSEESEVGGSSDSTSGGPTSCDGWMSPPAPLSVELPGLPQRALPRGRGMPLRSSARVWRASGVREPEHPRM